MPQPHNGDCQIRWLIRRDMPEVMEIEVNSFPAPWSEEDFTLALKQRNCIGMVAEDDDEILGYMVYESHKTSLVLINFAVHPQFRRCGVGTAMIAKLKWKLPRMKRKTIRVIVVEKNLEAQLFLRGQGFIAKNIIRNHFEDGTDAINFEYEIGQEAPPVRLTTARNRISGFLPGDE